MTDERRWLRVKEVFHEALERPPSARATYLDEACAGDEQLLEDVSSLLASDQEPVDWLEQPVSEAAAEMLMEEPAEEVVGRRIGPYRVERELGRGGMGAVYLAVRDDGQYRQQVAIKLTRSDMDSEQILRRFLQERQILASLQHANIARLLDGGVSPEGRSYLVMEYVEGVPIDTYCRLHELDLNRRLELFLKVCAAVSHAHGHLVVHCDLKPSNILVDGDGEPKLLDFGVAKILASKVDGDGVPTMPGIRLLTPAYASPEQVRGEQLSTASDIYSLGVLLYVLVSGHSPYLASRQSEDIERAICEQRPEPPSAAVARPGGAAGQVVSKLAARLRGDLDSITLMALSKEPSRRYGSVEQMARDLERHRADLPVAAHRDSPGYRARKFVRRHRVAVAAAVLVAFSLLVGIAVATWQARQAAEERSKAEDERSKAEDERRNAEDERRKAEDVAAFVVGLFQQGDPIQTRDPDLTLRDFLDSSAAQVDQELSTQPEVQARLFQIIGEGYRHLGLGERAREFLERALDERRQVLGARHPAVAESLESLGMLNLEEGDLEAASVLVEEALEQRRYFLGEKHEDVAQSLSSAGLVLRAQGRRAEAEPLLRSSLALRRELLGDQDRIVSVGLNNLGVLLHELERHEEARLLHEEALALRQALFGPRHLLVANSHLNLSTVLMELGERAQAEMHAQEALRLYRELLGPENPRVAVILSNSADLLRIAGKPDEALGLLREAIEIYQGRDRPLELASSWMLVGRAEFERHRLEAAEDAFNRSLELRRERLGVAHQHFVDSLFSLMTVHRARGSLPRAEGLLREVLAEWERRPPSRPWDVPYARGLLGEALLDKGNLEAARWLEEGRSGLSAIGREDLAQAFADRLAEIGAP